MVESIWSALRKSQVNWLFEGWSIRHYSVKFLVSNSYSVKFWEHPPPPYPTPVRGLSKTHILINFTWFRPLGGIRYHYSTSETSPQLLPNRIWAPWIIPFLYHLKCLIPLNPLNFRLIPLKSQNTPHPPTLPQYEVVRYQEFYGIVTYGWALK